jgi:sugar phosphate isomerase/epimerase
MRLGIFARTFPRDTLEETLDAVAAHGFDLVQFNMACVGLPTLPERIDPDVCKQVAEAFAMRRIRMAAISGTFNMIHPDRVQRRAGLRGLRTLAEACLALGTNTITLCTGTRDPDDMWRSHAANDSADAWHDLEASTREATRIADGSGIVVAFEPEVANVVDSPEKARRLLGTINSPRLKVVMDAANLFHYGELERQRDVIRNAFALLGRDIVLAHAKDITKDGEAGHEPAGKGRLDYVYYLSQLASHQPNCPLILHGLSEAQVDESVAFLRRVIAPVMSGTVSSC